MTDEIRSSCSSASSTSTERRRLPHDGPARPRRPVGGARRSTAPSSSDPVGPGHPVPPGQRRGGAGRLLRVSCARATCSSTTPTTSFATSVEEFIRQASVDPNVLAIKMTLYRTSGDSSIVQLADPGGRAGQAGGGPGRAQGPVRRGSNIEWAKRAGEGRRPRRLRPRRAQDRTPRPRWSSATSRTGMRRYCHIGTGNYNSKTARLYEDVGLLTCDPRSASDLTQLFNFLTGYARDVHYRTLLVAPHDLRPRPRADRATRCRPIGAAASDHAEDEQPGRPRADRARSTQAVAGRRADRPRHPRHLLPACPGCPACPTTSGCGRSSAATSSTPASTASPTATARRRPTGALHRLGRPDAPQPRPPGRGAGARSPTPTCATSSTRSSTSELADDILAWVLGADGAWHKDDRGGRVDSHRRLQELALARRLPS